VFPRPWQLASSPKGPSEPKPPFQALSSAYAFLCRWTKSEHFSLGYSRPWPDAHDPAMSYVGGCPKWELWYYCALKRFFFNFTMPWPRGFNEQEAGLSMCEELRRRVVYTGVGRPQRDRPCRVLQEHGPGIAGLVNGPSCTAQDALHAKCLTCRSCAVCISGRALRGWALWVHNAGWKHKSINAGGLGRRA
jgi:hypothetical protein